MQDPSLYPPPFPEQEHLKCPRCDSDNTKFCYYNNYNLSQPRHFCKSCRRHWTKGGTLRSIPVGGGSRKNGKRGSASSSPSSSAAKRPASSNDGEVTGGMPPKENGYEGQFGDYMGASGSLSFGSMMGSGEGQFSNFLDGSGLQMGGDHRFRDPGSGRLESGGSNNNNGGWSGGSNGWPDLSMYTPGSNFDL